MNRRPSPLDNEQCRQCSSFSDYVKVTKKKLKTDNKASTNSEGSANGQGDEDSQRSDCPLDRDELGHSTWGLLHTIAAKYPEKPTSAQQRDMKDLLAIISRVYPCEYCAKDLREDLQVDPPKTESYTKFSQWLCRLHNKVNVKLGKPVFNCSLIDERWRDGWKDGSCDEY